MSVEEEIRLLQTRAYRPARWLLALTALILLGAYLPFSAALFIMGIPELVYRILVPLALVGTFLLAQLLLDTWSVLRFRRLTGEWQVARDAA